MSSFFMFFDIDFENHRCAVADMMEHVSNCSEDPNQIIDSLRSKLESEGLRGEVFGPDDNDLPWYTRPISPSHRMTHGNLEIIGDLQIVGRALIVIEIRKRIKNTAPHPYRVSARHTSAK